MKTLWVDTNVLVRHIVGDVAEPGERARALMAEAQRGTVRLGIATAVGAEMAWVLDHYYKVPRAAAAGVLLQLVTADGCIVPEREVVIRALEFIRSSAQGPGEISGASAQGR